MFSETKSSLNWTKKKLPERIAVIEERGKLLDVFLRLTRFNTTLMLQRRFMAHYTVVRIV